MSRIELEAQNGTHDDEDAPFLGDEHPDGPAPGAAAYAAAPHFPRAASWQVRSPWMVVVLLSFIKFLAMTSALLFFMPMYRVIEDMFCHVHFEDTSAGFMDEMKCKVDEVQASLSSMMGWLSMLGAIMNLIVVYPYGVMSDKVGRKPTILLAYGGLAFTFVLTLMAMGPAQFALRENPYLMLGGTTLTLLGGGVPVLLTTMFAMVSDVSSDQNKATNFMYLALGAKAGTLCGPLFAGLLMDAYGPREPVLVAVFFCPVIFFLFALVPETLVMKKQKVDVSPPQPLVVVLKKHVREGLRDIYKSLAMVKDPNILLCLVTYLFSNARWSASSTTVTQYVSKYFGWTFGEISILLSPLSAIQLVVLFVMPMIAKVLTSERFGFTNFRKDLFLCQVSILLTILSALVCAFSPNVGVFITGLFIGSLSAGENPLIRAIISCYVDPTYTSRLYALTEMVVIAGAFTGGPVLAWCFNLGLQMRGFWTGLPWMYLALVCLITWLAMLFVRPPRRTWADTDDAFSNDELDDEPLTGNSIRLT